MPVLRFLLPVLGAASCLRAADPAPPSQGAAVFQNVCAQCHGTRGEGKVELKTPSIAGQPAWYAKIQLANFREGRRGHEPADPQAFMMAAIAKTLQPEQIAAVTAHVEKMPLVIPSAKEREMAGTDVADGARLYYERCMECHRYNGSGEMTFGSAPLIGLQSWYLEDQLRKFKSGKRGTVKSDINGAKMVQMTNQFIEDDQMLRNVVAYLMTLNPEPPAEEEKPEVHRGSPFQEAKTK